MKKLFLLLLLVISTSFIFKSVAQVNLNVNIGAQPAWGPAGYNHVDYYYLPDVESYYYVPKKQFIYLQNNDWVFANALPARYSDYDLYNGYKVVINSPTPYRNFTVHKVKYAKFKGNHGQAIIAKGKSQKYMATGAKGKPIKARQAGKGNSKGKGKH